MRKTLLLLAVVGMMGCEVQKAPTGKVATQPTVTRAATPVETQAQAVAAIKKLGGVVTIADETPDIHISLEIDDGP